MKRFLPILALVCLAGVPALTQNASPEPAPPASSAPVDKEVAANERKAREIITQAVQALGGTYYLNVRNRETQGRGYTFHHGRPSGMGVLFWSFVEYPDKERVEYTPERDVARVYVGNKAWEITYKGAKAIDEKDRQDYLRLHEFSLDNVLRVWVNQPGVIFLYEGNAIAAQHEAAKVTLINSQNESVTLFFDIDSHLPVKKTFEWRDPVDRQKNLEEEIYENYRESSGVMVPYNTTRYFNGDMAAERFLSGTVTLNMNLDETMFDPNSGYNPNKPVKGKK